jgi:hypothetical protein
MTHTNPTNIFNFIPHDVTQHVMNPFLTAEDRANFNAVLEPTERIYKRLPSDFAIKHSVKTFASAQRAHVTRITEAMDLCYDLLEKGIDRDSKPLRPLARYVTFIISPQAKLIFQHKAKAKQSALNDLNLFLDEQQCPFDRFMCMKMRVRILDAIDLVTATEFIREV